MPARIVSDSTGSFSPELAEKFGIEILPYYVIKNGSSFKEDLGFDRLKYYEELAQDRGLPTTSHPSLEDIISLYQRLLSSSSEPILHLAISSKYTLTYELALKAKDKFPEADITVFDTKSATAHQALMALEASRLALSGKSVPEIVDALKAERERFNEVICLNTLEYLARGGRIGKAAKFLGSLLSIKPLVGFDSDGETGAIGRARTHEDALKFILKKISSDLDRFHGKSLRVIIEDAGNKSQADLAEQALRENFPVDELYHTHISVVSGTHIGPGAWGVAYYIPF